MTPLLQQSTGNTAPRLVASTQPFIPSALRSDGECDSDQLFQKLFATGEKPSKFKGSAAFKNFISSSAEELARMAQTSTTILQGYIDRMNAGDLSARTDLINHACERLRRLTNKMVQDFPGVRRFEDSDDVLQNTVLRLMRRLEAVQVPSVAEFFRLAARETRRELLDLVRRHLNPQRPELVNAPASSDSNSPGPSSAAQTPETTFEPSRLAEWSEFHNRVEVLPDDERAVFDLVWYQGLSQVEAAAALGVPRATVQRAWLAARLRLKALLRGNGVD